MEFQSDVEDFMRDTGANYMRLCTPPGLIDIRPYTHNKYQITPSYTYIINLQNGEEQVWNDFKPELRRSIKKTEKAGVSVEEGSEEDLKFLYDALVRRLEEQGIKSSIYEEYLLDIYNSFYPKNLKIFVGKHKGETVGGEISVCYNGKLSAWIGIPKISMKGVYANDLIQWEAIKWAVKQGLKQYEIMDDGSDPRLCAFKSKYNPEATIWFSAIKYSSPLYMGLDKVVKPIYDKINKFRSNV